MWLFLMEMFMIVIKTIERPSNLTDNFSEMRFDEVRPKDRQRG